MAIYHHGETGRIVKIEGEDLAGKYIKLVDMKPWHLCERCGNIKDNDYSNYCEKCRTSFHGRVAKEYETRPYNERGKR